MPADGASARVPGPTGFTRDRVERIIALVVAFGCLALGAQALIAALGAADGGRWAVPLMLLAFVPLAAMLIACGTNRLVEPMCAVFVAAYTVVLLVWPFVTVASVSEAEAQPWPWYLVNVASVAVVVAFPLWAQVVACIALPLLFGIVRSAQGGFAADYVQRNALDVSFAMLLGAVLVVLGWMFRATAERVDVASTAAIASHADVAATAAVEQERLAVAALMHDSVLAALIAAERADSPRERDLAVGMARDTLLRLADAEGGDDHGSERPTSLRSVAADLRAAAATFGHAVTIDDPGAGRIPERVARAMVLAATQAVANAVQHAGGAGLAIAVGPYGIRGASVTVHDAGPGIDLDAIEDDRLGIRGSIFARLAAVGGGAGVGPGEDGGTVVVLRWEDA